MPEISLNPSSSCIRYCCCWMLVIGQWMQLHCKLETHKHQPSTTRCPIQVDSWTLVNLISCIYHTQGIWNYCVVQPSSMQSCVQRATVLFTLLPLGEYFSYCTVRWLCERAGKLFLNADIMLKSNVFASIEKRNLPHLRKHFCHILSTTLKQRHCF